MYKLQLKILLFGDSSARKTEIVKKYTVNRSNVSQLTTSGIGADHNEQVIYIDKYEIKMDIWDTLGQERYRSINKSFYKNADGIIFAYNIADYSSFDHIKKWIRLINERDIKCKYILCGNRADLGEEKKRQITIEELKKFGEKLEIPFYEICSKTGYNLNEAFHKLVEMIMENKTEVQLIREYGLNNYDENLEVYKKKKEEKRILYQKDQEEETINIFIKLEKLYKLNKYTKF